MRIRSIIFASACVLGAAIASASAQNLISLRKVVSSAAAKRLVEACLDFAARTPNVPMAIAVVDPSGNLISFHAMEGSTDDAILTAQLKARTAARWRRTTEELSDRVSKNINRAPEFVGDFPLPGGFPLFVEDVVIGAVGVSGGGGPAQNADCVEHAIQTVFGASAIAARPQ